MPRVEFAREEHRNVEANGWTSDHLSGFALTVEPALCSEKSADSVSPDFCINLSYMRCTNKSELEGQPPGSF